MEVVRNIQIKLDVSEDNHDVLDETFEQFQQSAQHVADYGWSDNPYKITDAKNTLHDETYSDVREKLSLFNPASHKAPATLHQRHSGTAKTALSKTVRKPVNPSSKARSSCITVEQSHTTTTTFLSPRPTSE